MISIIIMLIRLVAVLNIKKPIVIYKIMAIIFVITHGFSIPGAILLIISKLTALISKIESLKWGRILNIVCFSLVGFVMSILTLSINRETLIITVIT